MRTFGESFGCREASFRLSLAPAAARARCASWRGAPQEEIDAAAAAALAALGATVSVHLVEARRRRRARCACARSPRRMERWGLGGGIVSTARAGRRGGAAARARADRRHAARCRPSAASIPTTCSRSSSGAAARSRSTATARQRARVKVGVPTEIKADEYRVALTPAGVRELTERGHEVLIQAGAGEGSAIADADYEAQGARIVPDAEAVFGEAELILKVKEPQPEEVALLRPGPDAVHLPAPGAGARADAAACATRAPPASPTRPSRTRTGRLPLLAPMSEIAGKIATQAGAFMLEKPLGGRGILLGGVPGVAAANVLVIGGGVVGMNAAFIAIGMEADVFVFDTLDRPPARARHRARRALLDRLLARRSRSRRCCRAPTW